MTSGFSSNSNPPGLRTTTGAAQSTEESIQNLRRFVAGLNSKIDRFAVQQSSPKQFAREVLSVLRALIREESQAGASEDAIQKMFQRLWGSPGIRSIFQSLYERSSEVLESTAAAPLSVQDSISKLEEIVEWYERRRRNLIELESRGNLKGDRIFSMQCQAGRKYSGCEAVEVRCALQLAERFSQTLWLRVRVLQDTCLVLPAEGAETWIERSGILSCGAETELKQPFAAMLLVVAGPERSLIDSAHLFVPTGALKLEPGVRMLQIECALLSASGDLIHEIRQEIQCRVPARSEAKVPASPQSTGLWTIEPVSATQLSDLHVDADESMGLLKCKFSLNSFEEDESRMFVEWRLSSTDGFGIETRDATYADSSGAFCLLRSLKDISKDSSTGLRRLEVPIDLLDLAEAKHTLVSEVVVLDEFGQRVCGDSVTHEVRCSGLRVPGLGLQAVSSPQEEANAPLFEGPKLNQFEIEPYARWLSMPQLRVAFDLQLKPFIGQEVQVLCSIEHYIDERLAASPLAPKVVRRSLSFIPRADGSVQGCLHISHHELVASGFSRVNAKRILARIQVYSGSGVLLLNRTKLAPLPTFEADLASLPAENTLASLPASIERIQLEPEEGRLLLRSEVTITLKPQEIPSRKFSLYHEAVTMQGTSVHQSIGSTPGLTGQLERIEYGPELGMLTGQSTQLVLQVSDQLRGPTGQIPTPGMYAIKFMLFSEAGTLLQTLHQHFELKGSASQPEKMTIVEKSCSTQLLPQRQSLSKGPLGFFGKLFE
jgi:hypothetical protein